MKISLSAHQARLLRVRSQLLAGLDFPTTPVQVLQKIIAVQAQDLPSAYLSIRVRSRDITQKRVDDAREFDAAINWTWSFRGTLHLVTAEDTPWIIPLLGPGLIARDHSRLRQLGWEESDILKGIHLMVETLESHGSLTRAEIRQILRINNLPYEGQSPTHLIFRAVLEGLICIGKNQSKQQSFVLYPSRFSRLDEQARAIIISALAYRYLGAYGPAHPLDFAAWSGLRINEARNAWNSISDSIQEVDIENQPAWLRKDQLEWLQDLDNGQSCVNLLPRYDTYLLGYASRELMIESKNQKHLTPGGGIINAVVLVDGFVLGTWKMVVKKDHLLVDIILLDKSVFNYLPQIEAEVKDIGRFLERDARLSVTLTE